MRMHRRTRAETKCIRHAPRIQHGPPPCPRCSGNTVRANLTIEAVMDHWRALEGEGKA